MKVIIINGSPRKKCTYTGCQIIAKTLREQSIDSEILSINNLAIRGCSACNKCRDLHLNHCIFSDDLVNDWIEKIKSADGLIVGSPVYYSGINGTLKVIMDRMFYAAGHLFAYKPAAGFASSRRAGTITTIDAIDKFFLIYNMPLVSSCYWPMIHGQEIDEVYKDKEGIFTLELLAKNMAWLIQCINAGKETGISYLKTSNRPITNFIR